MTRFTMLITSALLISVFSAFYAVPALSAAEQEMPKAMAEAASAFIEPVQQEPLEKATEKTEAYTIITASPDEQPAAAPANTAAPSRNAPSAAGITAAEWEFFSAYGEDKDEDVIEAILPQLSAWLSANPEHGAAEKALFLRANLNLKLGNYKPAVLDLLRLLQESPGSEVSAAAGKTLGITADKKLDKKEKALLLTIAKGSGETGKAENLAFVLREMAGKFGQDFYEPLTVEFTEYFRRFPSYAGLDVLQLELGNLYAQKKEYVRARLAYEKLIFVYPDSALMARTKRLLGYVLAENIKDYFAAIKVYQDITNKFPGTPEAWAAYTQLPRLTEKQKQYPLAVEVYENIIKLYPDKPEARDAFKAEARVLRENLSKPAEAIAVLNRLADKYKDEKAIEELYLAAEIARKDLKDLDAEIRMYDRIAADYAADKAAPKALLDAGQAFEKNKNADKAKEYYERIVKDYPEDPVAKKAQKYIAALLKA